MPRASRTPPQDVGTLKGLLFHVNKELSNRDRELSRLYGDIAYLKRRKQKLEAIIFHKEKGKPETR